MRLLIRIAFCIHNDFFSKNKTAYPFNIFRSSSFVHGNISYARRLATFLANTAEQTMKILFTKRKWQSMITRFLSYSPCLYSLSVNICEHFSGQNQAFKLINCRFKQLLTVLFDCINLLLNERVLDRSIFVLQTGSIRSKFST